jgi:hypothetical protein
VNYWSIPRQWEGATVAVLASGQSLTQEAAEKVRHLPRITTNASYRMAPDADVLYASDVTFWQHQEYAGALQCNGLKVCVEQIPGIYPYLPDEIMVVRHGGTHGFTDEPGKIKTGGNSGYAATHLAASMGAKRILLLGLDLCGERWHGRHPNGLTNPKQPSFTSWIRNFRTLAPALKTRGIEVLNCSPISRLDAFPKANLSELL